MESLPRCVTELARAARAAPSADNSQPWQINYADQVLELGYASRVVGATFPAEHHATRLAMAACVENIVQAGRVIEVGLEQLPADNSHYARFRLDSVPTDSPALPDTHPLFLRHTNRFSFLRQPIPKSTIDTVMPLREGGSVVRVLADAQEIAALSTAVRLASSVRFSTQQTHELLAGSLRFSASDVECGDGLDVATLNLPPGGRALLKFTREWRSMERLNKFGLYRIFARAEADPVRKAPLLIAIVGGSANDAGRLMQRVWILLNGSGVAVQPYYVVSDELNRLESGQLSGHHAGQIRAAKAIVESLIGTAELHIVLRCGFPTRQPQRSKRLPLNRLFSG